MTDLKSSYDHVIIGGGYAADHAARAIREAQPDATIAILSAEKDAPMHRPALSKVLWFGDDPDVASQDLHTVADTGADLHLRTTVLSVDAEAHTVTTSSGATMAYGRLLLATGAAPAQFPGVADERVVYLRSAEDYRRIRDLATDGRRVAIVGGGYLGAELTAGIASSGADAELTLCFPQEHLLDTMFPESVTTPLAETFGGHGVRFRQGFRLREIRTGEQALTLVPEQGEELEADVVVLGLGSVPRIGLAQTAGAAVVDRGVQVDAQMRTSLPDVFAAGDIARFPDPLFGERTVEHVENAKGQGTVAGQAMAGGPAAYETTPMFYSVMFGIRYEAIGTLSTEHEIVETWNDEHDAGVLYYLEDGVVEGIALWNVPDKVDAAREVAEKSRAGKLAASELTAQIAPEK